ncbi:uncharacterized protein CLUP02_10466 [Colletotrichum lupini]|uniref:Uncharacterized protein n=1 Tax=Colletotrichum lupini TaxID=145971 RepID=A0A9Q8SXK5_9PEZI|nr:uncharacterized protein CLUP02_10466 [Colletotrichum lupini]UQC84970.1 hypothetical protein CLUP02_10466 [Colletotrichum lupini]
MPMSNENHCFIPSSTDLLSSFTVRYLSKRAQCPKLKMKGEVTIESNRREEAARLSIEPTPFPAALYAPTKVTKRCAVTQRALPVVHGSFLSTFSEYPLSLFFPLSFGFFPPHLPLSLCAAFSNFLQPLSLSISRHGLLCCTPVTSFTFFGFRRSWFLSLSGSRRNWAENPSDRTLDIKLHRCPSSREPMLVTDVGIGSQAHRPHGPLQYRYGYPSGHHPSIGHPSRHHRKLISTTTPPYVISCPCLFYQRGNTSSHPGLEDCSLAVVDRGSFGSSYGYSLLQYPLPTPSSRAVQLSLGMSLYDWSYCTFLLLTCCIHYAPTLFILVFIWRNSSTSCRCQSNPRLCHSCRPSSRVARGLEAADTRTLTRQAPCSSPRYTDREQKKLELGMPTSSPTDLQLTIVLIVAPHQIVPNRMSFLGPGQDITGGLSIRSSSRDVAVNCVGLFIGDALLPSTKHQAELFGERQLRLPLDQAGPRLSPACGHYIGLLGSFRSGHIDSHCKPMKAQHHLVALSYLVASSRLVFTLKRRRPSAQIDHLPRIAWPRLGASATNGDTKAIQLGQSTTKSSLHLRPLLPVDWDAESPAVLPPKFAYTPAIF